MPGGVDIHSHIAGTKVNAGRAFRPDDKLVDFNEERYKRVKLDEAGIQISAIALEADFLINLPVLKTHMQTGYL